MSKYLQKINRSAYKYHEAIQDQFLDICKPLFDFGIKYFGYCQLMSDGSYLSIINSEKYANNYLSSIENTGSFFTNIYQVDSPIAKSQNTDHYAILMGENTKDPILSLLHECGMWNWFIIYKCNPNGINPSYAFGASIDDIFFPQFCLNNISVLEHFISYFNENAKHIIDVNDKKRLAHYKENLISTPYTKEDDLDQRVAKFLRETKINRIPINGKHKEVYLSKREAECLFHLSDGKTAKEIGRALGLSPRTIEEYLSIAKEKAGYDSKSELLCSFTRSVNSIYFKKI